MWQLLRTTAEGMATSGLVTDWSEWWAWLGGCAVMVVPRPPVQKPPIAELLDRTTQTSTITYSQRSRKELVELELVELPDLKHLPARSEE